jgi:hypothetical protein
VVHEFECGRGTIRSTLNQFSGKTFVDIRLWVEPRDEPGAALIATKAGLHIPLEFLPELSEALETIDEAVKHDQGELARRSAAQSVKLPQPHAATIRNG